MYGDYINPYMYGGIPSVGTTQPFPQPPPQQNVLPPQTILQANGRESIQALRMSPNSSVYIEDATNRNVIWKCVSDSLGNVTSTPFDISIHEDTPILSPESLIAIVGEMNDRITKLEEFFDEPSKSTNATTDSITATKG